MISGPTLYKARGVPTKHPVCALCVDRTRGRTTRLDLGHGAHVWPCAPHASLELQTQRAGRDLVLTLPRLWPPNGCLTQPRQRALHRHLAAHNPANAQKRPRPGSYAWPEVRKRVEHALATGTTLERITAAPADPRPFGHPPPPSPATLQRWRRERRWLATPPPPIRAT